MSGMLAMSVFPPCLQPPLGLSSEQFTSQSIFFLTDTSDFEIMSVEKKAKIVIQTISPFFSIGQKTSTRLFAIGAIGAHFRFCHLDECVTSCWIVV